MAFEDLKDQLKDRFSEVLNRLQESPAYNNIRERYETLAPNSQRALIAGTIAVVVILLLMIPFSYFSSSSDQNDNYGATRDKIRRLLHAGRLATEATNMPRTVDIDGLKSSIQESLGTFSLLPEQNAGISDLDPKSVGSGLAAGSLTPKAIGVTLKKLSLKQLVEVGYELQDKGANVKLAGVDITATTPDPHYYDVVYTLVVYNMPGIGGSANADSDDGAGESKAPPSGGGNINTGGRKGGPGLGGPRPRPKPGNNTSTGTPPPEDAAGGSTDQ